MMTTKMRSPHALIRAIETNVRAFVDGAKTRGAFDRRARVLWDEAALDPTVYADLSAYFAKVTLARGTGGETRVCARGEHGACANAAHCGCACHRIPDSCPHSATQNMGGACERCIERATR